MDNVSIGFLGFGEVGFAFSKGLKAENTLSIHAYDGAQNQDGYGEIIRKRSQDTEVVLVKTEKELADTCTLIFCAVPGSASTQAARNIMEHLNSNHIYVDLTTSKPNVKLENERLINRNGARYVDGAIVSPVPTFKHKVTIFACGSGAEAFNTIMKPFGMNIRIVAGATGQASLLKMLRSSFTKGLEALLLETMIAARKLNAEDIIIDSISETMDGAPFAETINRHICENAIHGKRRVHEVQNVAEILRNNGVEPIVATGTINRLQKVAGFKLDEYFNYTPPESYKSVLQAIEERVDSAAT